MQTNEESRWGEECEVVHRGASKHEEGKSGHDPGQFHCALLETCYTSQYSASW